MSRHQAHPIRHLGAATLLAGSLLLHACGEPQPRAASDDAGGPGPRPTLLWSLPVQEHDSLFISSPAEFAIGADGAFYIGDRFAGRVLKVDRAGRPVMVYGRKGRGPGEFREVSQMFDRGDRLFVDDAGTGTFNVFDRATGKPVGVRRHEGVFYDVRLRGDTAWMGMQNLTRGSAVARWDMSADSMEYLVPVPSEYRRSPPLAGIYNGVFVVPWADTLLVAFQGSDELYLFSSAGRALDTVSLPVRRRRGVPDDIVSRLEKMPYPEMFSAASGVFSVGRLSGGRTAVVHFDQRIEGSAISAEAFVSLVSGDRRRACVDGALPGSRDAPPRVLFRGDTLFVLEQRLTEDERAQTSVSAYLLNTDGCAWTAVP